MQPFINIAGMPYGTVVRCSFGERHNIIAMVIATPSDDVSTDEGTTASFLQPICLVLDGDAASEVEPSPYFQHHQTCTVTGYVTEILT